MRMVVQDRGGKDDKTRSGNNFSFYLNLKKMFKTKMFAFGIQLCQFILPCKTVSNLPTQSEFISFKSVNDIQAK